MRLCWSFLKEHKERVEILSRKKQDHLGFLGGDGENEEDSEIEEENGGWEEEEVAEFLGTWREEFDDLYAKLEE